ncbi:MAG: RDD family protein [Anaerolineae bacterium]|nr:RDD family protein [Anaerolineae bacterium]
MNVERDTSSTTYELASVGARFIALIIDSIILLIVSVFIGLCVLTLIPSDSFATVFGLALNIGYNWYFIARRGGQTPGKSAMGIQVIKTDGSAITDTDGLIRAIGSYVSSIPLLLGFIWAFFDANNQTWHDKMANTYVIIDPKRRTVTL